MDIEYTIYFGRSRLDSDLFIFTLTEGIVFTATSDSDYFLFVIAIAVVTLAGDTGRLA